MTNTNSTNIGDTPFAERLRNMTDASQKEMEEVLEENLSNIYARGTAKPLRHVTGRIVQVRLKDLQPGHQIVWNRSPYYHHAIVVNVNHNKQSGYVINFNGHVHVGELIAKIQLQKVNFSKEKGTLGKVNYISCDSTDLVLARAYSLVKEHREVKDDGMFTCLCRTLCQCCTNHDQCYCNCCFCLCDYRGYHPLNSNCEHFANWCKTGEWKSIQTATVGKISIYRIVSIYWNFIIWTLVRVCLAFFIQFGSATDNFKVYIPFIEGDVEMITLAVGIVLEFVSLIVLEFRYCCECYQLYQKEQEELEIDCPNSDEYIHINCGNESDITEDYSRGLCDMWSCICRESCYKNKTRYTSLGIDCNRAQDCTNILMYLRRFIVISFSVIICHLIINYIGYTYQRAYWTNDKNASHVFMFLSITYFVALVLGEILFFCAGYMFNYCVIPFCLCTCIKGNHHSSTNADTIIENTSAV